MSEASGRNNVICFIAAGNEVGFSIKDHKITDQFGRMATHATTESGKKIRLVESPELATKDEPCLVVNRFDILEGMASLRGNAYNYPGRPEGKITTTSPIISLHFETKHIVPAGDVVAIRADKTDDPWRSLIGLAK